MRLLLPIAFIILLRSPGIRGSAHGVEFQSGKVPSVSSNDSTEHWQVSTIERGGGSRGGLQALSKTARNSNPSWKMTDTRRRHLTVLLVGSALMNDSLQVSMLLPMIHSLVTSPPPLGVPDSSAEIAMGIFFAAKDMLQLTTAPLAGVLVSRTSSHRALFLSTAALGAATLLFSQATTFAQLLVARAAQGAASAAVLTGGLTLIAETHPAAVRGTAMGWAYAGLALGRVVGPLLGGALFAAWGRQTTFRLAASVVLLNAVLQFFFLEGGETKTLQQSTAPSRSDRLTNKAPKSSEWAAMRRLLQNPDIVVVATSILVIHAVLGVMKPLSQVVLAREFGVEVVGRSLVISIATVTYMLSTPLSGRLSDVRFSRSSMVVAGLALMSVSAVFFGLRSVWGMPALYASVALLGTALGVSSSASQALLADLVDRQKDGSGDYSMAFALSDMADSIGMILGPVAGLAISQSFGPTCGVASIAAGCVVLLPLVAGIK